MAHFQYSHRQEFERKEFKDIDVLVFWSTFLLVLQIKCSCDVIIWQPYLNFLVYAIILCAWCSVVHFFPSNNQLQTKQNLVA